MRWSDEQTAMLRGLWPEVDLTADTIACIIRTRTMGPVELDGRCVMSRVRWLKLPPRRKPRTPERWTEDEIDTLYREWPKGTAIDVIATMCHKTIEQVTGKRRACLLEPRRSAAGNRKPKDVAVVTYVPEAVAKEIERAAISVHMTRSRYLAKVICAKFEPKVPARPAPLQLTLQAAE